MPRLPRRISLIDETGAVLRQRIDEGASSGLPTDRILANLSAAVKEFGGHVRQNFQRRDEW